MARHVFRNDNSSSCHTTWGAKYEYRKKQYMNGGAVNLLRLIKVKSSCDASRDKVDERHCCFNLEGDTDKFLHDIGVEVTLLATGSCTFNLYNSPWSNHPSVSPGRVCAWLKSILQCAEQDRT